MAKCNRVGCPKEGARHSIVDMGNGLIADVWGCEEHYHAIMDTIMDSLNKKE